MSEDEALSLAHKKWQSIFWGSVACGCIALVLATKTPNIHSSTKTTLQLSCSIFLCSLLGLWSGTGKNASRITMGMLGATVVATLFAAEHLFFTTVINPVFHFQFCYLIFGIVAAAVFFSRRQLACVSSEAILKSNTNSDIQFNLLQLLSWTTLMATFLAIAKGLNFFSGDQTLGQTLFISAPTSFFGILASIQIFAWISENVTDVQVTYLLGTNILFLLCCSLFFANGGTWAIAGLGGQAMLAFSLYCLRAQDYRLVDLREIR